MKQKQNIHILLVAICFSTMQLFYSCFFAFAQNTAQENIKQGSDKQVNNLQKKIFEKKNANLFVSKIFPNKNTDQKQHTYIIKLKDPKNLNQFSKVISQLQGNFVQQNIKQIFSFKENNLSKKTTNNSEQERVIEQAKNELKKYFMLELPAENLEKNLPLLINSGLTEAIFQNHVYKIETFNDSAYKSQWALQKIEAENAWRITMGDSSVVVGFIDTGVDIYHDDLKKNLRVNPNEDINKNGRFEPWSNKEKRNGLFGDMNGIDEDNDGFTDNVLGYDFTDQTVLNIGDTKSRDADPSDENGHGTNIAGIIAAEQGNSIGISGVAPNISLLPLRAFDYSGNGEDDDISAAIVYAAEKNVSVLNMSFGDFYYSPLMLDAINYAVSKGVVCCAASGNSGGIKNHYPSSYPNVISVGMSAEEDYIHPFSTGSPNLSLAAPGVDIATTGLNNSYKNVTGTSAATPHISAVCGLIRSLHKTWSPREIRAVLELTSDDIAAKGWDEFAGAGRLNMRRALQAVATSELYISSPQNGTNIGLDTMLKIHGTIKSPLFKSWELYWGLGYAPEQWTKISNSEKILVNNLIGSTKIELKNDTTINLRLVLKQSDGRSSERRCVLYAESSKTTITDFKIEDAISTDASAKAITARTNSLSRMYLFIKLKNSNSFYQQIEHETERISGLQRNHFVLLTNLDLLPEVEYSAYVVFKNTKNDTVMYASPEQPITLKLNNSNFPTSNFSRKNYTLPYGFLCDEISNMYSQNEATILINKFESGSFSKLAAFNFVKDTFKLMDTTENWVPRGIGKLDASGKKIVLAQALNKGVIYSQEKPNANPFAKIIFSDINSRNFTPSALYDFDNDGTDEVVAYSSDTSGGYFAIYKFSNSIIPLQASVIAVLRDFTKPAKNQKLNALSTPDIVISDFNHNGKIDILMSDEDGDFFMYEMQSLNNFTPIWSKEFDAVSGGAFLTKIDFDGSKNYGFAIGNRLSSTENSDGEYEPSLWKIQVLSLDNNNKENIVYKNNIAQIRTTLPFRSGLNAMDIDNDGREELLVSTAPNFYILKYSTTEKIFKPLWHKPTAMVNKPLAFDFDKDGTKEISVGNGDKFYFYQIKKNDIEAPACTGFRAYSISETKVQCTWEAQSNAENYAVYKAEYNLENQPTNFQLVSLTMSNNIIDSGLVENKYYLYFVVAVYNDSLESNPSNTSLAFTHKPTKILSIEELPNNKFKLNLSNYIKDDLYRSGVVEIKSAINGKQYPISSVINGSEKSLIVTCLESILTDTLEINLTGLFRDYYNSPANQESVKIFVKREKIVNYCLYALQTKQLSQNSFFITFNGILDKNSCENLQNFSIAPDVGISSVKCSNDTLFITTVNGLKPNGKSYFITIKNLISEQKSKLCDSIYVLGFALQESSLENVYTFPQPFSISKDEKMFFAGLTIGAKVEIYTKLGKPIISLKETEGNGGLMWDGKDNQGNYVPSGVYVYRVLNLSQDLEELKNSGWRKFVITQ